MRLCSLQLLLYRVYHALNEKLVIVRIETYTIFEVRMG